MKYPIVLEATVGPLTANTIGAPNDTRGLQNRSSKPLRVDELRFRLINTELASNTILLATSPYRCQAQLRIGNEPITNGFVPVPAMTWPIGDYEFESDVLLIGFTSAFVARLSKPVYLMPGQTINFQARHTVVGGSITMILTAICREVDEPVGGYTPWFTHYASPVHTDGGGNFEDVSTESDLVNPFDDEMDIERLIGRTFTTDTAGFAVPIEIDVFTAPAGQFGFAFDALRVRAEDHEATQIVRDATPFGVVFDFIRKSWVVNTRLASKGFYRVSVQANLATTLVSAGRGVATLIGMLGYRAVR